MYTENQINEFTGVSEAWCNTPEGPQMCKVLGAYEDVGVWVRPLSPRESLMYPNPNDTRGLPSWYLDPKECKPEYPKCHVHFPR